MIMDFEGVNPIINKNTYISESVDIVGEVKVEENANIWFGARLRGDVNEIVIGENTNVQENSVIHVDITSSCIIGKNVTIGHGAIIHGCNISDNVLVGIKLDQEGDYLYVATMHEVSESKIKRRLHSGRIRKCGN